MSILLDPFKGERNILHYLHRSIPKLQVMFRSTVEQTGNRSFVQSLDESPCGVAFLMLSKSLRHFRLNSYVYEHEVRGGSLGQRQESV